MHNVQQRFNYICGKLRAFAKFRKASISLVESVRLSVRPSVRPYGTIRTHLTDEDGNFMVGACLKSDKNI
jgi:hypothetical protein